jgi:hypothetical protein
MVKESPKMYRAVCDGCGLNDHALATSSDRAVKDVVNRPASKWALSRDGMSLYCHDCKVKFGLDKQ